MYSILPACVAALFLGYGIYAVCAKGFTRTTLSFFGVCITSFFWQGTWAILFQIRDPHWAIWLVKIGYFFILFLPTSLYHFLTEISESTDERRYVFLSYGFAGVLAIFLAASNLFVDGYFDYFWGYYPKAGILHPLHVLQTIVVVNRGLYISYRQRNRAAAWRRAKLNLCIGGILTYFFAAVDYACNYGVEFYPPGVVFISVSLGIITIAIVKYDLLNPMAVAATIAHEVRTPLVSIRMQAKGLNRYLPALLDSYRLAVRHGLCEQSIPPHMIERLEELGNTIAQEIDRTNIAIDMLLAAVRTENFDGDTFDFHSLEYCVKETLDRYAFDLGDRTLVQVGPLEDFRFYGSDKLLVLVLFNLIKNALYAIRVADKGGIRIWATRSPETNELHFQDTGTGIAPDDLPHIFDPFFTTKKSTGYGLGLAFCQRVMTSFGGRICCDSVAGEYTVFTLEFPVAPDENMDRRDGAKARRTMTIQEPSLSGRA